MHEECVAQCEVCTADSPLPDAADWLRTSAEAARAAEELRRQREVLMLAEEQRLRQKFGDEDAKAWYSRDFGLHSDFVAG